ncbi:ABC transporter substrate-binding protein [Streptomyces albireticuli]|uniref:ABC transporter substrate-binding protein n=2 Tax=Streptomyces albireticuli TaxID=1940 RepID=UPI001E312CC4|nr:ABC transporter substrate-binding protein [Streptomyces albireticuli]MCD9141692.1 ABC transporter substrate-binding protein [Streptomyces albireticuli]MCD9165944.1 ABC transporter substrate-binding protein [Streptomyces albireticuli]MCD9189866.1 ABC transporter substrate-binding protein [Streptomyces albireticuli]
MPHPRTRPRPGRRALVPLLATAALLLSGCANPSTGSAEDDPTAPVTLRFWHGWSEKNEVKAIDDSIARFRELHPNIRVKTTGNVTDATVNQALRAGGGNAPDVVSSFTTDNVGQYCSSGMWADLDPFLKKSGMAKERIFPEVLLDYTRYRGKQCALPLLADSFGMYYNKDAFERAGITRPPRTMSELRRTAVRLTERTADGSYRRLGFMPDFRLYQNSPDRLFAQWGPAYFDEDGRSRLARGGAAKDFLTTQRDMVTALGGYGALEKFRTTFGDEMSSQNAFLTGKLAMHMDGEWRGLMLDAAKPGFRWGTAPMPVPDDQADAYGRGYLTGTVAGIAHSSRHQNAAWELVRFLTADTDQVVAFANAIHNVPSTKAALASPKLARDPAFRTFLDIARHPRSVSMPPSVNGGRYIVSLRDFAYRTEAGRVPDLEKGLRRLDRQIDEDNLQSRN